MSEDLMIVSREFSRAEAVDVLAQIALLEESIRMLRTKAMRALATPKLRLVEDKECPQQKQLKD